MKSNDIDRKVSDVKDYNFYMFIELNRYFFSLLPFLLLLFLQFFFSFPTFRLKERTRMEDVEESYLFSFHRGLRAFTALPPVRRGV